MRINVDCHVPGLGERLDEVLAHVERVSEKVEWLIKTIQPMIERIDERIEKMGNTLDDVLAIVEATSTVEDSIITLLTGIKKQLDEVLAAGGTPSDQQAKIDAIFAKVTENKQKLSDVVVANTPAAEAPTA